MERSAIRERSSHARGGPRISLALHPGYVCRPSHRRAIEPTASSPAALELAATLVTRDRAIIAYGVLRNELQSEAGLLPHQGEQAGGELLDAGLHRLLEHPAIVDAGLTSRCHLARLVGPGDLAGAGIDQAGVEGRLEVALAGQAEVALVDGAVLGHRAGYQVFDVQELADLPRGPRIDIAGQGKVLPPHPGLELLAPDDAKVDLDQLDSERVLGGLSAAVVPPLILRLGLELQDGDAGLFAARVRGRKRRDWRRKKREQQGTTKDERRNAPHDSASCKGMTDLIISRRRYLAALIGPTKS